jgi:hypothetical protein
MGTPPRSRPDVLFNAVKVPTFAVFMLYLWVGGGKEEGEFVWTLGCFALAVFVVFLSSVLPDIADRAKRLGRWVYGQVAAEFSGPPKLTLPADAAPTPLRRARPLPLPAVAEAFWESVAAFYARRGVPWAPTAFVIGGVYETALLAMAFLTGPPPYPPRKPEDLALMATIFGALLAAAPPVLALFGPWIARHTTPEL